MLSWTVAAVACGAVIAGCNAKGKEPQMRVLSKQEATEQVRSYARTLAASFGASADQAETRVSDSPCQGRGGEVAEDGRFYVQGNYQMPLEPGEHPRVLSQLRDSWEQQGYTIKEFRMFNATEGTVSVENPTDEMQISLQSTRPPQALAVIIITPCYMPPHR